MPAMKAGGPPKPTMVPAWPQRLQAASTVKVSPSAHTHSPPIRNEKAQTRNVARLKPK